MMYVLRTVFGIDERYLLCPASEKDGEYLLSEIMEAGNFGKFDSRRKHHEGKSFFRSPIWRVWYFGWRKWRGRMKMLICYLKVIIVFLSQIDVEL